MAQEKIRTKHKEAQDAARRFELLQGSKDKLEEELQLCIKQRRTAEIAWHAEKRALSDEVSVRVHRMIQ